VKITRLLLACGVLAGPVFIMVFLVEGLMRADYDPMRHPVSSLAFGDGGWIQATNFLITGLLLLAFALGARRALRPGPASTWGPLLIAACGVGLLGAVAFAADPLSGYPPGTPVLPVVRTMPGVLHDLFSSFFFLGLPTACLVFARGFAKLGARGWTSYSLITAAVFALAFVLSSVAFRQTPNFVDFGGLFQRITIVVGFAWLSLMADHLYRETAASE
jgi:hypothetical protein